MTNRVLAADESWAYLRMNTIGRIITTAADGTVDIFPVSYTTYSGEILIPTRLGTKLRSIATHPETLFEIDGHDDDAHVVWSVVVRARAHFTPTLAERRHAEQVHLTPLADIDANQVVTLVPQKISGREYRTR
ncbi:pyridoxamine 5'-phosphate oxidase family protein [Tsukamurella tyrosinosolvens]|uniref:Pyridoxamine 5'-phosphate oxidase family protein n=1 Tax=Tsukamurella columbiensis TaxID=128509 RepID=A0ABX1LLP4_9ACTN|nr:MULTISPECIES: pyridoxamine 5'-phosphate oxidase family protein [Tsukamurella]MCA4997437.1 pyridoxamine 5'-phosphate oxidase family protein [Tsukamurella tyrosinosolvens]NMD58402.1 pyridoxamine 5'-phosphate oxidase family protein [Tsukamurella columbiensis]